MTTVTTAIPHNDDDNDDCSQPAISNHSKIQSRSAQHNSKREANYWPNKTGKDTSGKTGLAVRRCRGKQLMKLSYTWCKLTTHRCFNLMRSSTYMLLWAV